MIQCAVCGTIKGETNNWWSLAYRVAPLGNGVPADQRHHYGMYMVKQAEPGDAQMLLETDWVGWVQLCGEGCLAKAESIVRGQLGNVVGFRRTGEAGK